MGGNRQLDEIGKAESELNICGVRETSVSERGVSE